MAGGSCCCSSTRCEESSVVDASKSVG
jgi:hypothetical protein